jgi:hypothetical protein
MSTQTQEQSTEYPSNDAGVKICKCEWEVIVINWHRGKSLACKNINSKKTTARQGVEFNYLIDWEGGVGSLKTGLYQDQRK